MSDQGKPPPARRATADEMRAKLRADPEIAKIAKNVEMSLEEFIEGVLVYHANPDLPPQLTVVSDEELKQKGIAVLTSEQLEANMMATVNTINASKGPTEYAETKVEPVKLNGAPTDQPLTERDPSLEEGIKKQRIPRKG